MAGSTPSSEGAELQWPVVRATTISAISGLNLEPKPIKMDRSKDPGDDTYSVRLRGSFTSKDSSLLFRDTTVKPAADSSFYITVKLTGELTPLAFTSINAYGGTEKSYYEVFFRDWSSFRASDKNSEKRPNPGGTTLAAPPGVFILGVGLSSISYQETQVKDYYSAALTAKANYSRQFISPNWNLGVGGYLTLLPLLENYSASARFLGLNFRLGYHFLSVASPWKISLYAGTYYTTMFVSKNQFGFEKMVGPQIYPVFQRMLDGNRSLRGYFKFAPLASTSSGLTLQSREIAGGIDYTYDFSSAKPNSVSFDASNILIQLPFQTLSAKTFTVGWSRGL